MCKAMFKNNNRTPQLLILGTVCICHFNFVATKDSRGLFNLVCRQQWQTESKSLTPNTPLIQLWGARSKWNMDLKLVFLD